MKRLRMCFLFLPVLVLASCSGGNNPEKIAEKFNKAIYTADFESAKALCTDQSKQAVDFVAAFASQKVDEMKKANIQFEVTNVTLAEDGNSAVVEAVVLGSIDLEKGGVKDSVDTETNLVKIQDKWLVEFKLK